MSERIVKEISDNTFHGEQHGAPDYIELVVLVNRSCLQNIFGGWLGPKHVVTRITDLTIPVDRRKTFTSEMPYHEYKKIMRELAKTVKTKS